MAGFGIDRSLFSGCTNSLLFFQGFGAGSASAFFRKSGIAVTPTSYENCVIADVVLRR
jgi:hypothetical protein